MNIRKVLLMHKIIMELKKELSGYDTEVTKHLTRLGNLLEELGDTEE